jgi:hypothetical protein
MVNTIGATAQTILTQRSSRGTMTALKAIQPRPMVKRRRLTRESPTRKPTSFKSKLNSSQKQTQLIIMTLRRIQKVTKEVTINQ